MHPSKFNLYPLRKNGKGTAGAPRPAMASPPSMSTPSLQPPAPSSLRPPSPSGMSTYSDRSYSDRSCNSASGILQHASGNDLAVVKASVAVNYLHAKQRQLMWSTGAPGEGVVLRQSRGTYVACPEELSDVRGGLFDAVACLNVRIAMTVTTDSIRILLSMQHQAYIEIQAGLRLQILPSIAHLGTCQVHNMGAFIQDSATLVVWGDDPNRIVNWVAGIEEQILTASISYGKGSPSKSVLVTEKPLGELDDKVEVRTEQPRRIALLHSVLSAFTLALLMAAMGAGWRQIAIEIDSDRKMLRLAFVLVMPLQAWLGLFFFQSIVGCVAQIIGPINQTTQNSKFYSGAPPVQSNNPTRALPHVTIQCPVYKEGLHAVIEPTVRSLKAAISTYEMQGGSANIFINDDGMQVISKYDAQLRQDFYAENHVSWVARPKHNTDASNGESIFVRAGRFKKASNMNYALAVSVRVEEKLAAYDRPGLWTQADEEDAYHRSLQEVIDEDGGKTWADGNIRVGDYILLVDSDTRVPQDCFLDPVVEMEQSPEVAIIQFPSGVLNVTRSFFENGISFFTCLVYTAISYVVSCGDICPFVGHNALLRWSAVQEVAFQEMSQTPDGDRSAEKYWSENTVSEDFDLALRLQTVGYIIRLAVYKGTDFKEGVSLTVYDELARWKKYAYGCSELIFNPFYYWPTRGPFTPIFRKFMISGMPLPSKISILSYVGTYYAIGSAYLMITANFFLVGWDLQGLDHYYIDSFRILFSVIVVFSLCCMVSLAILRYRKGDMNFFAALIQNLKWVFLLYIFFGGISMHVSGAIIAHLFGINVQWGATMKEAQDTTFFVEIAKLLRRFWVTFTYCIVMTFALIYFTRFAPVFWRIDEFIAIYPLATLVFSHFMMPIALNPSLMRFTW